MELVEFGVPPIPAALGALQLTSRRIGATWQSGREMPLEGAGITPQGGTRQVEWSMLHTIAAQTGLPLRSLLTVLANRPWLLRRPQRIASNCICSLVPPGKCSVVVMLGGVGRT